MLLGIDHIGLMTADPARVGQLLDLLGLHRTDGGTAAAYGVSCDFWQYSDDPGAPAVEVVAPTGPGSVIQQHLTTAGPGLYHVAFEVDDIDHEFRRLRGAGLVPVDARPCAGARPGMRVAFMYAGRPADLLVELVQYSTPRR